MLNRLIVLMLLALFSIPSAVMGQGAGQVVDVRPSAQIISGGSTRTIAQGNPVSSGDIIRTGASGQVQILFPDETKIVIGPNSSMKINETLFRANGTARKFATTALAGSFRFISGKSPKNVYKLSTPVATMGIRGTAFDYTVNRGQSADLLVFNGLVHFCASDRRCANVPGGCQAVSVERNGDFSQPQSAEEKQDQLTRRFPLLVGQADLQLPFRAATDGCGSARLISLPSKAKDRERGERNSPNGSPGSGGGGGNPAD